MLDSRERLGNFGAYGLRWRIATLQFGKGKFEFMNLAIELVVFGVTDFGRVVAVVTLTVIRDERP